MTLDCKFVPRVIGRHWRFDVSGTAAGGGRRRCRSSRSAELPRGGLPAGRRRLNRLNEPSFPEVCSVDHLSVDHLDGF